jgi:hypothetical protein
MKLRVIKQFKDKAFNNEIVREVGDIIDTNDESFRCDEELAKARIKGKFVEEIKEAPKFNKDENKGKKEKHK